MATTNIKFEYSPAESLAESFASSPGQMYSPLFDDDSSMNPMDVMTPKSFDEDSILDNSTDGLVNLTDLVSPKGPDSEKKPIKKRKSWGQQLPEPKTNLPPRKRAKTEDEKEQRRVERVLRNRRAAQSSRERKRLEVEALEAQKLAAERRNADLELQLAEMQARNALLMSELERIGGSNNMAIFRGSSVSSSPRQAEPVRSTPAPITFSQDLFGSHEETNQPTTLATSSSLPQTPVQTVDPASLSPEIKPVAESDSNASSSDLTQHPAVSVGRTTALDGFELDSFNSHLNTFNNADDDFGSYLSGPQPTESDHDLFENRLLPLADEFATHFDHLADHHDNVFNSFDLDDFLHNDDQSNPQAEIHAQDQLAEKTANLQPLLGASLDGCDGRGNAVSI